MNKTNRTLSLRLAAAALMALVAFASQALAAPVAVQSYVYPLNQAGAKPDNYYRDFGVPAASITPSTIFAPGDLTDGNVGFANFDAVSNLLDTTVGFGGQGGAADATKHPLIVFNLGTTKSLATTSISYIYAAASTGFGNLYAYPAGVTIRTSNDNVNWSAPVSFGGFGSQPPVNTTNVFPDRILETNTLNLAGLSGKYVEMAFQRGGAGGGTNSTWTFLTEVSFTAAEAAPEPGSLAILSLCGVAMLYARRQQRGRRVA